MRRGGRCCSTGYVSGNQVFGSPLVAIENGVLLSKSNTKTPSNTCLGFGTN